MCKLSKPAYTVIALIVFLGSVFFHTLCLAANSTYASLPPFISSETKPNVVLVVDFSGSMQFPAYYGTNGSPSFSSSKVYITTYYGNVNVTYDKNTVYYGYFDSDAYYEYNSSEEYWEKKEQSTYSGREAGHVDTLSGNFLNFIVTTRVDAVLKNLIGGKATCPTGKDYCILRPQGAARCHYQSSSYGYVNVTNLNARCEIFPENYSSGSYVDKDVKINISGSSSTIGTFSGRYAKVKVDKSERTGIIQDNFSSVRFAYIGYANTGNSDAMLGTIKYGVHESADTTLTEETRIANLVSSLESSIPYYGTSTGEAMRQAYAYLTQDSTKAYSYNSSYISKGTKKDPYYKLLGTTLKPAWCRESYVVLISDGEWNGSLDPGTWAHSLHTDDLRADTVNFPGDQIADVFSLFAFSNSAAGLNSMQTIAAFGSYTENSGCSNNLPYDISKLTSSNKSLNITFPRPNCNPSGTYKDCCNEWDSDDNDGVPDTFYYASSGDAMAEALSEIFQQIQQGTASGTAVTALTSKVSSGNVIAQGAFYPEKEFDDFKTVVWTGDVFSEWYLNGYYANASGVSTLVQNIREDSDHDFILDVADDRILEYLIEDQSLTIYAYDATEYGTAADATPDRTYFSIEDAENLFDCGELLMARSPYDRTIYAVSESDEMLTFTGKNEYDHASTLADNTDEFDTLLGTLESEYPDCLKDANGPKYDDLISYTRGETIGTCRSRQTSSATSSENVWKIGDIIYSSPIVVEYNDFSMIFAGSNAGMLHAFRLGYLKTYRSTQQPAKLCDDNTASTCTHDSTGKEEWAFIPKDAMPYLRYMANPYYDHLYGVDLKPQIVNTGSKVILIGGMRMGGACNNGSINPPSDTNPVGRSAYFALDITDPLKPEYLWRYAPDGMGFTYSGPAYIKRKDASGNWHHFIMFASGPTDYKGHSTQNLEIFTVDLFTGAEMNVFGDVTSEMNITNAFGGRLFTDGVDINDDGQTDFIFLGITSNADGNFDKHRGGMIKIYIGSTALATAAASAVAAAAADPTDTVKAAAATAAKAAAADAAADPTNWEYTTNFLAFADNPIVAPVKVMDCFPDELDFPFLYFGTGRYFSSEDQTQDGTNDYNRLYGVPFIYDENNNRIAGGSGISSASNSSALTCDALNAINTNPQQAAWYIDLDPAAGNYYRERCYSDPTTTDYNVVFFSTTKPIGVACECGGQSRSWVLNCATGQSIFDVICDDADEDPSQFLVDPAIQFNYLVQLSGGDINQYDETDFSESGGRATAWAEGVNAETGGLPTFPPGSTLGQMLYWKQW